MNEALDPPDYAAEVLDLAKVVKTVSSAYGLNAKEEEFLHRIATTHELAVQCLPVLLTEGHEGAGELPGPADFEKVTQLIVEVLQSDLADVRGELNLLARPEVAEAFATITLDGGGRSVIFLQLLVDAIEPLVSHQTKPAVEWLRGRGADSAGYGLNAEEAYEAAVGLDPTWRPALISLAGLLCDRGDSVRALSLLDRAGVDPDDGLYKMLTTFGSGNVLELRRNDPCWCGSGRKLKQCHRDEPALPLSRRASWLYHKASAFLQDGPWRSHIMDLALERSRYGGRSEMLHALADPLVMSSMLFEGGVIDVFAATRGPLLPDDEYGLLMRWMSADRGCYEVEKVNEGVGMLVRNILDGERTYVHEVLGSTQVHEGMLFVTLVLPIDDAAFGFFGGIEPIAMTQRDKVIKLLDGGAEPLALVAAMTDRFAPMQFNTSSGEQLEPTTCVIKIKGRRLIPRVFDMQFSRDSETSWSAGIDGKAIEDGATVGGFLELKGREVTINTMSLMRMDMLLDAIEDMGFEFDVLSEQTINVQELLANKQVGGAEPKRLFDPKDPEISALMEQMVLKHEADWLDMSIPALGGLTPRQAAQDPTARNDVIALLNSFPVGIPGAMSSDRLRAALDI